MLLGIFDKEWNAKELSIVCTSFIAIYIFYLLIIDDGSYHIKTHELQDYIFYHLIPWVMFRYSLIAENVENMYS